MVRLAPALLVILTGLIRPGALPAQENPAPAEPLPRSVPEYDPDVALGHGDALALARFPDRVVDLRLPASDRPPETHLVQPSRGVWTTTEPGEKADTGLVFRTAILEDETRPGLRLPVPAQVAWDLPLPANAVLSLQATILPATAATYPSSDGADLVVEIQQGSTATELHRERLKVGSWTPLRIPLTTRHEGTTRLKLRTEDRRLLDPDAPPPTVFDTVFVADPVVFVPKERPRRILLFFIDTLRPDHLGLHGYHRNTSPNLDRWSRRAVVFGNARATAPWTLPSVRSLLTGHQPDAWSEVPNLAELLGRRGWHTAAVFDNPYLSDRFGMERGWSQHIAHNKRPAGEIVEEGESILAANPDRDTLLLLHFMEPHLPYDEPYPYRRLWAGDRPSFLPDRFTRSSIAERRMDDSQQRRLSHYIVDRYDQSIRSLDHELARALRNIREDDIAVVFSDHGEEFWEHGGFEHGHALWDELLRVVLMIRAPGLEPRSVTAPVSLQDLVPTLLALLGIADSESAGISLLPLIQGRGQAAAELERRPQAFSSPLYGRDAWGSLVGHRKLILRDGQQWMFDLEADPGETVDISTTVPMKTVQGAFRGMEQGLGRPLRWCWRFSTGLRNLAEPLEVEIQRPGGFAEVWRAYDPEGRWKAHPALENGSIRIVQAGGALMPREFFAASADGNLDPAGITVTLRHDDTVWTEEVPVASRWRDGTVVLQAGAGRITLSLDVVKAAGRGRAEDEVPLVDAEVERRLKALGYAQ